ncbi:kinectin isoform X3 [Xenopus laevis]|uniref:Kinectin isoform X3 n=1 Tax=Xenopus laevis TaxID=8355 RepID=A0A8J1LPD5_XENLA|nr:kinectin isoform X3 [Xenopus laevis]
MEFYESTYFIVLVPSVVIMVIFLFFWLFMKETSYDEVLAKQKKDQKPPPAKIEKKKTDKKKNKKKEAQNGNLHESDSETAMRDFELVDALSSEEEHVVPTPVVSAEPIGNIKERKKKDKKPSKPVEEQVNKEINGTKLPSKKPEPVPVTKQSTPPPPDTGAAKKKAGQKKQKNGRDDSPLSPETKNEQVVPSSKKQEPLSPPVEVKPQESGAGGKKKTNVKKQKIENVSGLVDEPLIQPTVYIPLMDNSELNVVEKKETANLEKSELPENPPKSSGKKMKTVTDKENAEVKFKDFIVSLRSMVFTEEEALSLVDVLKAKSNAVQEIIHKANRGDAAAALQLQEKEKQLIAAKDEASVVKEQCKQLTQELVAEKQKLNLVEAKARERITLLEKEHGVYQSKMHGSYQEAQQMQLKFQQVREQLDNQISHLKQENSILRDAVSSATNQMESKQSSDLNKLRQDYTRLMNELTEKNNRVAQEELQKKNSEQAAVQLKAQMQEAERSWKEMEKYLRARITEFEVAQQDLQGKLITKDSEVQSLHSKLTDTMVSKQQLEQKIMQLMDAGQGDSLQVQDLVKQNEALNAQVQKFHTQITAQSSVIVEGLQKTIAEKDMEIKQMAVEHAQFANSGEELKELLKERKKYHTQIAAQSTALAVVEELQRTVVEKEKEIKQMHDSLTHEHVNFTNSKEELKMVQRDNAAIKSELQSLHALKDETVILNHALEQMQRSVMEKDEQIRILDERLKAELAKVSSNIEDFKANKDTLGQLEKSSQEKDEKIKTVEELLETGLIQLANKEEELRTMRNENESMRSGLKTLQEQQTAQISLTSVLEELKNQIHEKEGTIKSVQDLLQAEQQKVNSQEATVRALNQEMESLKEALRNSQLEKAEQLSNGAQVQELQNELRNKEDSLKNIEMRFKEREKDIVDRERQIQDLDKECKVLKAHTEEVQKKLQQSESTSSQAENLQSRLAEQEEKVRNTEASLLEKEKSINDKSQELQVSSAVHSEQLLKTLAEKDRHITELQSELESLKSAVEQQRKKNNDLREKNWKAMEALASTEKMLQERMNKTAKEQQQLAQTAETQARQILQKLFPSVSVSVGLCHSDWVQEFEKGARNCLNESAGAEKLKVMEEKLKEGEETHTMLQLECEKYKSVLAETEGILQRLQRSVEEEEGKWKLKVEESQQELDKVKCTVCTLEKELENLRKKDKATENLQKDINHLESELEKAESERSTYVSEVRELKDLLTELQRKLDGSYSEAIRQNEELILLKSQLNETLLKLEGEQSERQKVASDLHEAQKSLDLIQLEILKASGDANVIENSDVSPEMEEQEKKEKLMPSLSQTVTKLQQCLQAVNQQLTKGRETFQIIG